MASGGGYGTSYPPHSQYNPNTQSTLALQDGGYSYKLEETNSIERNRHVARTPSPTPSEAKELAKSGVFDWKEMANWRFWFRREWLWYYVALVIIGVLAGLMTLYHKQIVNWLKPAAEWLHELKFGWLVPIGILFVISFPPLFGHEIVAVLCGLIWGLWIGFGIVSAGTFIGEVGNFYAFKYCLRSRGEKLERQSIQYACLAKVVRDGGFVIALVARLSAIPGHFTTAVFSTCGMGIIVFSLAAILSMPKQFITVYLGVILEQSESGTKDTKSRIISDVVLALTAVITVVAMWYIYHRMNKVKVEVIRLRRKRRQGKVDRASSVQQQSPSSYGRSEFNPYGNHENAFASESTIRFESQTDIPLTAPGSTSRPIQAPQPRSYAGGYAGGGYGDYPGKSYDARSDSDHGSSIGHDMYNATPYMTADSYARSQYAPPANVATPRSSMSSSRQPIASNAMYYTQSSPPPELPIASKFARSTSPPNFSRARSPPIASTPRSPPPNYPNPISVIPPSDLPYASPSSPTLHSPFDDPEPTPVAVSRQHPQSSGTPYLSPSRGHTKETTDASFITAREPSSWEPPTGGDYGRSHHRLETSEGPRPPGYFAP